MAKIIRIQAGTLEMSAELNDSKTSQSIWEALPITGNANLWGDEIYFSIPLNLGTEDGKEVVAMGDLAYWAPGNAFCIFFGPTPASQGEEVRPASPVSVFGKIIGDATQFKQVRSGNLIKIVSESDS
jgi:hypothetical protein